MYIWGTIIFWKISIIGSYNFVYQSIFFSFSSPQLQVISSLLESLVNRKLNNQTTTTSTTPPVCVENDEQRAGFFPNVDYALYGYNIFYGYPLAIGHDPGLTRPIFEADYSDDLHFSADCSYHIPRGFYLAPDVSCKTSFERKPSESE